MQHQEQPTSPVVPLNNEGSSVWWENEPQAVEEPDLNIADHSFERIQGMVAKYKFKNLLPHGESLKLMINS